MGKRLFDTNGDGVPDAREFAGSHRYNTAVALAERFAKDEGSVSTVIIASGETQVDAVTAAGLAGNLNAPVLLTRSNMLPHNVARYIDEHNVTNVIIVGGAAAVPDAIMTAIESLGSKPVVERIGEADRYATAAAIGDRLGGPNPTWCGSTQTAAILVNGGDAGRADAVVAGPLAYRLGLPVLLTMADELPESTSSFLTTNKVERVVIIGGDAAVSPGVKNTLIEDVGVVNAPRISGGSAAETSVMVAKEMLGNCADVLQTNRDLVALVNRDATADGITAAPVLGRGLGVAGSVPILLVGEELPAAVSDFLAGTAEWRDGHGKTHLSIVAIGGTAVVGEAVMDAAKAAAKTSSELTATITPLKYTAAHLAAGTIPAGKAVGDYTTQFRVTFSDNVKLAVDSADDNNEVVDEAERRGTVEDPTMYRINGRRIEASTSTGAAATEPVSLLDLVFTADRTVTLTLSHHLETGDTITVDNSANEAAGLRLGASGDKRKLEPAEMKLGAVTLAADRSAPVVQVVAVPDTTTFDVLVTEPNVLYSEIFQNNASGSNLTDFVKVDGRGTRELTVSTAALPTANTSPVKAWGRATVHHRYRVTVSENLQHGDTIIIERSAILDKGGRRSPLVRYTVPKVKTNTAPPAGTGNLEITSVSIGNVVHGNANGTGHATGTILTEALSVTAKATGVAAGAAGNGWRIFGYDDRSNGSASTDKFKIGVAVDTANQRISYTISDVLPLTPRLAGAAKIGDLAHALASNTDFAANFSLSYVNTGDTKGDLLGGTTPAGVPLSGGISKVGVVVKFNAAIASLTGTDLAADIAPKIDTTATPADIVTVSHMAPDNEVHISYTSASMLRLPARSGFRVIAADVATGYGDTTVTPNVTAQTSIREILNSLRPDSSIKP